MSGPEVIVHRDRPLLAEATAARLALRLADAQTGDRTAGVGLTGGGVGIELLRRLAGSPLRELVDWGRVEVWWGDERFVPADDPERNELQAREALLDGLPLDPARVHPMSSSDGRAGGDPDLAAAAYAEELARAGGPESIDVLLLGMGDEGHTASIFPSSPAASADGTAVAVRDCPKPPPTRISLTFPAIRSAAEVWMVVAGAEKADVVRRALAGERETELPAAGARGRERTLWLLDVEAAAALPS